MEKGKLLILRQNSFLFSLLIADNRLLSVMAQKEAPKEAPKDEADTNIGNIYIGKIQNIVHNIGAVFVEIQKGIPGFIKLEDCRKAVVLNRIPDGRLLNGDEILVQVTKEAAKKKSATLTSEICLKGKYCICNYGSGRIHISHKLSKDKKDDILHFLKQKEYSLSEGAIGFIIRTNAGELTDYHCLYAEMLSLQKQLLKIVEHSGQRTCFSCLYQAPPSYLSYIQDTYENQYDEIITDCPDIYQAITEFMLQTGNSSIPVRQYQDEKISLANLYGITAKLETATEKRVWLKSGAYLFIEATEALTVIDVNTGQYTGKKDNSMDTFRTINREAAEEIALQLRLRNISGIIIVDFINMTELSLQEELLHYMTELVAKDAVRTTVIDITPLGLMEITRQKINKPLSEQLYG